MAMSLTNFRNMNRYPKPRRGATLIDVAIGSMLLTLLLIPSFQWIGHSQSINRRLEDRDAMLFEAEQLIETFRVKMSYRDAFDDVYSRSIDDLTKIQTPGGAIFLARYQIGPDTTVGKSELLNINVAIWRDTISNGSLDLTETSESMHTQVAAP